VGIVGFDCRGLDVIDWEPQVRRQGPHACRHVCMPATRSQCIGWHGLTAGHMQFRMASW
jgi:hypothetical protein